MKFLSSILLILFCGTVLSQQLVVNNTGPNGVPNSLVGNYLGGGGIDIFNVSYSGNAAQQIGYYSSGTNALGSNSGIAISTGNVLNASLPNTSTSMGTNLGATSPGDADVIQLANGQTVTDWFILEFDVIPIGNQISLQYIFASEEYNEYVCAAEADGFAVLMSGAGIAGPYANGAENVALVPSTSNPAGINSINNGIVGTFGTPGGCSNGAASPYYNDNIDSLMEFDGYTDVMTINQTAECGGVYHVRIIIFDCGAKNFDSAIFLPEDGLTTNGSGVYNHYAYHDTVIVEGCAPYEFVIYNVAGFTAQSMTMQIGGTAQNGVDYQTLANPIVLPAGNNFYTLSILPIADGVAEGFETVTISFDMINLCGDTMSYGFTIYIQDENPITVTSFPTDQTICAGSAVTLLTNVSGGFPAYAIFWNGIPGNNISVIPGSTTTYLCEIYDQAGCSHFESFTVNVYPIPIVNAGPDFSICQGQQQVLGVWIDGGQGATYTWTPAMQLNANTVPYPILTASSSQTYNITVSNPGGCTSSDVISVTVLPLPTVDAGPDQTIVYQQTSTQLQGSGSGTPQWTPNYYLTCDFCYLPYSNPDQTTTYTLTITATNGCYVSDEVTVTVMTPTDVFVPSAFSPNGDGNNDELYIRGYTMSFVKFKVYDMWGQIMFETTDPSKGWDGTVNGTKASIGLYTWTADVVFVNGAGEVSLAGEVNLVR